MTTQFAAQYTRSQPRLVEGLTRAETCETYRRKVILIARRLYRRYGGSGSVGVDDLVSAGSIGLLEAFERFDPSQGLKFTSYATWRIRGAMHDLMRNDDVFSRRRRDLSKKVRRARERVEQRLGRPAEPEEVAEELEVDLDEYWEMVDKVKPVVHASLDNPVGPEDDGLTLGEVTADPRAADAFERLEREQIRDALKASIGELPERTRQMVLMYYGKDLTQREIAEVYDVSVPRISQILSKARRQLRTSLTTRLDGAALAAFGGSP